MDKKLIFKIYILPVLSLVLLFAVWKSAGLLKESYFVLPNLMVKYLPFTTNPLKDGGEVLVRIEDEIGDNGIDCSYVLPENPGFDDAYELTDLIECTIRKPLDSLSGKVWNIDIGMMKTRSNPDNPAGFDLVKGSIYLDLPDNDVVGHNKQSSTGEKISFSEGFSWDYLVEFDCYHGEGILKSAETEKTYPVKLIYFEKQSVIRLGIPLVESINAKIDKKSAGQIIVAVGFYSPYDRNGLLPVREFPDRTASGAGTDYEYKSPYYDFISSDIEYPVQGFAKINPIDIDRYVPDDFNSELAVKEIELKKLSEESYDSAYEASDYEEINEGIKLYDDKKNAEAEKYFSKYLGLSSSANTYTAVITAVKAGTTNDSSKKIAYVEKSYEYFDRAEALIKDDGDLYLYSTNLIGVSLSVPDEVFGKLDTAKEGIIRLMELDLSKQEKAKYYLSLIDIYRKKNDITGLKKINMELESFLK